MNTAASVRACASGLFASNRFGGYYDTRNVMTRQQLLDLYFMDARFRLIEIAAFLDRLDRAGGDADFRLDAFRDALKHLADNQPERAKNILLSFSDPTVEPIAKAPGKGAVGAWPGMAAVAGSAV